MAVCQSAVSYQWAPKHAAVGCCVQVLGDSFFDPAEERVPMSPAMALEAARVSTDTQHIIQ